MSIFNKKKKAQLKSDGNHKSKVSDEHDVDPFSLGVATQTANNELTTSEQEVTQVKVEELPLDFKMDHSHMFEIQDITVVARLDGLVHGSAQQVLHEVQQQSVKNALQSAETLLQSDIPLDRLTKARGIPQGYRATLMGEKGIERNAVLRQYDTSKITQSGRVAVGLSRMMSTATFVVCQYHMSEISSRLSDINRNIRSIGDFQQREFKSKIMALINNVEEVSRYSYETLENSDLRIRELHHLNGYKDDAVQQMEQVNVTIHDVTNGSISKIQEYQSKVDELDKLLEYQRILIAILEKISVLTYTLNLGEASTDKCFSSYNNMLNQSNELRKLMPVWHQSNLDKLGIEPRKNRFKKQGVEGLVSKPLSIFDRKLLYKKLDPDFKKMIIRQSRHNEIGISTPIGLFEEDVEVINKDGKWYYVPSPKDNNQ